MSMGRYFCCCCVLHGLNVHIFTENCVICNSTGQCLWIERIFEIHLFIILNMRYMQGYVSNILGQCLHLLLSSNEKNQKLNRTGKYTHTVMLMIAPLAYMLLLIGFPNNMFYLMLFMQFFLWMHVWCALLCSVMQWTVGNSPHCWKSVAWICIKYYLAVRCLWLKNEDRW